MPMFVAQAGVVLCGIIIFGAWLVGTWNEYAKRGSYRGMLLAGLVIGVAGTAFWLFAPWSGWFD